MKNLTGIFVGIVLFVLSLYWIFNLPSSIVETVEICPVARTAVEVSLNELPEAEVEIIDPTKFCSFKYSNMIKAVRLASLRTYLDLVGKTVDGPTLKTSLGKNRPDFYFTESYFSKSDRLLIIYKIDVGQVLSVIFLAGLISGVVGWAVAFVVGKVIKKTTKET